MTWSPVYIQFVGSASRTRIEVGLCDQRPDELNLTIFGIHPARVHRIVGTRYRGRRCWVLMLKHMEKTDVTSR